MGLFFGSLLLFHHQFVLLRDAGPVRHFRRVDQIQHDTKGPHHYDGLIGGHDRRPIDHPSQGFRRGRMGMTRPLESRDAEEFVESVCRRVFTIHEIGE